MKRLFLFLTFAASCASAADRLPAFPGAEGAGKWSLGGRGGRLIEVTNLHDDGPGSLRVALDAREPRTVIFRVSGTIELTKPLRILHPFITVAGQTAPGDGICLKGFDLQIGTTHDVIVRHLRCRPGDKTSQPGEIDALTIWDAQNVIVDHCSATWSTDECLSVTRDSDRITVQHCLIAEALTSHGLGSIIGSYHGQISFLHNLYASNRARNPRPSGYQTMKGHENDPGPRIDFRHNVIFNWQSGAGYTGGDDARQPERIAMNYVGNYLKPGADTSSTYRSVALTIYAGSTAEIYLEGNQIENPPQPINVQSELLMLKPGSTLILRDKPLPFEPLAVKLAYPQALEEVGAVKPKRDAVDTRIITGVRDGTGRLPTTLAPDAWPELKAGEPLLDTDHDGLPDAWEQAHGLTANDPSDSSKPSPQGWTHLELWMNSL
ncbi:MAG: pectate lyase [Prosthecobacter sp.]